METSSIHTVCDHIIVRCSETDTYLDMLKLQKLLYYCQAWNLAFGRGPLFTEKFQAWVHGPVSREIYDRFASKKMYAQITTEDIRTESDDTLQPEDMQLVASVLSAYGAMTGDQLEYLTHTESPWQQARQGVAPNQRSENIILEETMAEFYKARL